MTCGRTVSILAICVICYANNLLSAAESRRRAKALLLRAAGIKMPAASPSRPLPQCQSQSALGLSSVRGLRKVRHVGRRERSGKKSRKKTRFVFLLLDYWYFLVFWLLEAEAEFELRVLEDRDVVVVHVVGVLAHDLKLDEVVLVCHRRNVDAENEVLCD